MRKLQTQDIFKALRVVNGANLKEGLKEIVKKSGDGKIDVKDVGMDIIFEIFEKAADTKIEEMLYDFLAGPLEMSAKEVKEMEITALICNLKECTDSEGWKNFFKSVSALIMK